MKKGSASIATPSYFAGRIETPFGPALAMVDEKRRLMRFGFLAECDNGRWQIADFNLRWDESAVAEIARQIDAYFAGSLKQFDLPLAPIGTVFQQAVWTELRRIPFGETTSYARLAAKLQRPQASRAVGAANGANPISLIVPCHRVVGSSGALTGYAGGIALKEALLRFEGAIA
ncbi:methylated-DNA--[protein]-cysteine S-methyltransferase [Dongia soli]|uniref:Methylated-DNA--protein-cysteine methyltransferase n=1 Tax=Dongia soli TaxID=600628 RepID=A0ABU5EHU6_9PROT|nr:methylated-DNA--[protein]-cysteine S-methyltransferase [Dongia soli]MDY0885604.1 methylated-DNA--[protein]-cysteine S-methyltransferase [Dongia soli]